jgi:hypothetical protein
MSWFTLALGLIKEAAGTEVGQDIINDMRPGSARDRPKTASEAEPSATDEWRRSVESRFGVADRNTEMLVRMLNAQDEALIRIQKRQRIWNLSLSGAIILTAIAVVWAWLR